MRGQRFSTKKNKSCAGRTSTLFFGWRQQHLCRW